MRVEELRERWPALFSMDEINAEFLRITTVPLQTRFLASLDKHYSRFIEIIRNKGGSVREKSREILAVLDQSLDVNLRQECLLKCLTVYLGEDDGQLIKDYLVSILALIIKALEIKYVILIELTTHSLYTTHKKSGIFDFQKDEAESEFGRCTMAVFVLREERNPLQAPQEIGIVIEGVEVLNELLSVTHAFAMLFGLIYVLNLSYPSELRHTFEALQKYL
ncbi:hypothetical protein QTP86_020824 [Hemibagrus guttatus]|nr:hypothetical protein QTP86_020824 [Hemibagrus guttatus]